MGEFLTSNDLRKVAEVFSKVSEQPPELLIICHPDEVQSFKDACDEMGIKY